MRRIGILGGMSWESTAVYYRQLNEGIRDRLGGLHSASLLLDSVDFAEIAELQRRADWQQAGERLGRAAHGLQQAGAGAILLATNTMHKIAPAIEAQIDIPLLHIGGAVGQTLQARGVRRAALLGTRFTMQEDFYRQRLAERYGIEVLLPSVEQMAEIDRVIFAELCRGEFTNKSRTFYLECLSQLAELGAEAAILGCTEIGLLLADEQTSIPISTAPSCMCRWDWSGCWPIREHPPVMTKATGLFFCRWHYAVNKSFPFPLSPFPFPLSPVID